MAAHYLHVYIYPAFRRPPIQLSDTIRCTKLRTRCAYTYLTWSWSELFRKQTILYRIWLHAIKILNTTCLVSTHRGGFCIPWSRLLRALATPLRRTQGVSIFINDTRFPKGDNLKRKQNNFGFINISHKATLAIKEKRIAFRALTSNLNFYTLWPTWWVSH